MARTPAKAPSPKSYLSEEEALLLADTLAFVKTTGDQLARYGSETATRLTQTDSLIHLSEGANPSSGYLPLPDTAAQLVLERIDAEVKMQRSLAAAGILLQQDPTA